jgi:hypothetical protein
MREVCWHTLRVMGAKELVRRRIQAGWPLERCTSSRGWRVVCTTCLEDVNQPTTEGRTP